MTANFSAKRLMTLAGVFLCGCLLLALSYQSVFSSSTSLQPTNGEAFTLSAPETLALHPGEAFTFTVSISATASFTQPITVTALSDPLIPLTFMTTTLTGTADLDISGQVSPAIELNQEYTITVAADSPGMTQTADIVVTVDNYKQHLPAIFNDYCAATYVEEFNDPATSGWPVVDDGRTALRYIDGNYSILQRQENSYLILAVDEWKYAETNMMKIDGFRVSGDGIWGLAFGINADWSEFYTFEIYPAQREYLILHYVRESGWSLIGRGAYATFINNTGANTLFINQEDKNNAPKLSINYKGTSVASFYFPEGRIGIVSGAFTANADQRFDKYYLVKGTCPVPSGLSAPQVELQSFERPSLDELLDTQPTE